MLTLQKFVLGSAGIVSQKLAQQSQCILPSQLGISSTGPNPYPNSMQLSPKSIASQLYCHHVQLVVDKPHMQAECNANAQAQF